VIGTIPKRWGWLVVLFRWHCRRYARKRFHQVGLSKQSAALPLDGDPILIAMNHPSWWDPILCFILFSQFQGYRHFGAMETRALDRYRFLKRAGVFPVELESYRGTAEFLRTSTRILEHDRHVVWITAQGEFADVRKRPLALRPGVGHLAARMNRGWVVPVAVEYAFWNESNPVALIRFGTALHVGKFQDGKTGTVMIESELTLTLDALNEESLSRDASRFTPLVQGRVGVGGAYDLARRLRSWFTGSKFNAAHEGPRL